MTAHLAVASCSGCLLSRDATGNFNPLKRQTSPPSVEEDALSSVIPLFSVQHVNWDEDKKSDWTAKPEF